MLHIAADTVTAKGAHEEILKKNRENSKIFFNGI